MNQVQRSVRVEADTGQTIALERLQALSLEPGDALAITLPAGMGQEQVQYALEQLRMLFPENRVLLLPTGTEIRVVRP